MVLRVFLLLQLLFVGITSKAQIFEEITVKQFATYVDSLLEKGEIVKAHDEFYIYTNFLPRYNERMRYREELLSLQKRVDNAQPRLNNLSQKKTYSRYYEDRISKILNDKHYQKIIYFLYNYKDSIRNAAILFDSIYRLLPYDTIDLIGSGMPMQLYTVPQVGNYYTPQTITDNILFYRKNDSTLYTGVIISRHNEPMSIETEIAALTYDRFENGKRVERNYQGYAFSNYLHKNQLFFGHDSSHYRLSYSVYYKSDTVRTYFLGYKEELIKEQVSLTQKNGANNLIKEIEYNLDGTIKKWKELAPISEKHSEYDSYWCWLNQYGDTINEEFVIVKDGLDIHQERTLNTNGDTITLFRTVNSFLDGLHIENRQSSDGLNFELRYVFDNGTLIDILSDSVLYFNKEWKIISKEDYIHLMNQDDDDYSDFYPGMFNEYFPDVEFKTHPYFLSTSYIGLNNYKQFKNVVRKHFKVKL